MAIKIFISPSDQTKNVYAVGNTNEAEQCGRIAEAERKALERCGFEVMVLQYATMAEKCLESDAFGADVHQPLHTNGFDGKVAGTRIMSYDLKGRGYQIAKAIFDRLAPITPGTSENVTAHPELYEIRVPKAPTAYVEVDFHDNPVAAQWIIDNPEAIGEALCQGLCDYFGVAYVPPELPKEDETPVPEEAAPVKPEKRYETLGDVTSEFYRPTLDKLVERGILRGKAGSGEDMVIDLGEDAVRLLVMLDRAGMFGN